jgi:pimeloyl-ACP methyl ester carboxylesterase
VIPPAARRWILRVLAVLLFIVFAGMTYQGVATALERRRNPRPGGMIRSTDHQLHLYCRGEGRPVVVLEAAAAGMSAEWGWVQADVEPVTRICAYDRSGLGWSEWGAEPFAPERAAEQLDALLTNAEEPAPYVIAGHGLGAAFATIYAATFPDKVDALVLIDPPAQGAAAGVAFRRAELRTVNLWPWLARVGITRATKMLSRRADGLPAEAAGAMKTFLNRPDHLTRAAIEINEWDGIVDRAARAELPERIAVSRTDAAGTTDPLALLSDTNEAAKASAAILTAVALVNPTHIAR